MTSAKPFGILVGARGEGYIAVIAGIADIGKATYHGGNRDTENNHVKAGVELVIPGVESWNPFRILIGVTGGGDAQIAKIAKIAKNRRD